MKLVWTDYHSDNGFVHESHVIQARNLAQVIQDNADRAIMERDREIARLEQMLIVKDQP
jgi:hypothetical protein